MENFIHELSQRARITPDQSKFAVQYMTEYFKKNLPLPIAEQVNNLMNGEMATTPAAVVATLA